MAEQVCLLPSSALPPPIKAQRGELARAGSKQLILLLCFLLQLLLLLLLLLGREKKKAGSSWCYWQPANSQQFKCQHSFNLMCALATCFNQIVQDGILYPNAVPPA